MANDSKQNEAVSRRLEPNFWRTTQRESGHDYEQRDTARKWARIAASIIAYQNKHNGLSPTDLMISKDTGLSPGQVQYHLRLMESAGLVQDSKGWPRVIRVTNVAKVQSMVTPNRIPEQATEKVKEARVNNAQKIFDGPLTRRGTPRKRAYTAREARPKAEVPKVYVKRRAFMARARQVAEAILDHYDQHGRAPTGQYLRDKVYGVGARGSLVTIARQMVDLGWLHHEYKHHADYALTGAGRAALFGEVNERLHTDTPVNPKEQATVSPMPEPRREPRPSIPRLVTETTTAPINPASIPGTVEWLEAMRSPPIASVEVRRATPEPVAPMAPPQEASSGNLKGVHDVDLVIELTSRGFKVSR